MKKLLLVTLFALALTGLQIPRFPGSVALATDTVCTGFLGPIAVMGDVVVPPGNFCLMTGTRVWGSVKVMPGAKGADIVGGFIQGSWDSPGPFGTADNESIKIIDSTVGGSVYIAGQVPGVQGLICQSSIRGDVTYKNNMNGNFVGGATCGLDFPLGNTIHGNLIIEKNSGAMTIDGNDVLGDVVVQDNTGTLLIDLNRVGKTLKCWNNTPPPTGAGNTAQKAEGQCTGFIVP